MVGLVQGDPGVGEVGLDDELRVGGARGPEQGDVDVPVVGHRDDRVCRHDLNNHGHGEYARVQSQHTAVFGQWKHLHQWVHSDEYKSIGRKESKLASPGPEPVQRDLPLRHELLLADNKLEDRRAALTIDNEERVIEFLDVDIPIGLVTCGTGQRVAV